MAEDEFTRLRPKNWRVELMDTLLTMKMSPPPDDLDIQLQGRIGLVVDDLQQGREPDPEDLLMLLHNKVEIPELIRNHIADLIDPNVPAKRGAGALTREAKSLRVALVSTRYPEILAEVKEEREPGLKYDYGPAKEARRRLADEINQGGLDMISEDSIEKILTEIRRDYDWG